MNANKGRIRALPSGVANNVRASHVIGSQQRGVEELLQNAILHGEAKKVIVTLGNDNTIIVEDDGVGIDNESMRLLIGTEACTNNASHQVFGSQGRGESLRCVAALCVEVTIESTFLSNNRSLVSSTKLIRYGVTVSFEDSTDHNMPSSILPMMRSSIKTTQGTRITLRNFFQQFAVRRNHRSENLLSHIRSMLTMMSMIYPLVSFKLFNGAGEVDVLLDAPLSAEEFSGALTCRVPHQLGVSATLEDEADALLDRINKINSTSSDEDLGRTIKLAGEGGNVRAFGVIIVHDEDAICRGGRKMQFAVNGRPAAQAKQLAEFVQERIKKHFGGGNAYTTSGFIHIAAKESELVINESTAMEMSNLGSITKLLAILISNAIDDNLLDAYKQHPSEDCSNNNDVRHSRIVKGEYTTNPSNGGFHKSQLSTGYQNSPNQTPPNKSSPFSNIFCETNPQCNSADEDIKSKISFDEAFLDESITMEDTEGMSYDDTEQAEQPTMSWTRQRIKHFNSSIAELNPSGAQSDKISFTKDQLASAEVIAQVDNSFITVKMGSLLCLVDQHAADERVSLETLEEAFTRHDSHDGMKISLTKRDIQLGDIFKSCPVAPSIKVHLTMTQMTVARHYHSLLHKWKFSFEESNSEDRTVVLRGLPSVCGRVAQVDDMLEFLNDLGALAGGSSIKPKFVSTVLASNACRYATMFGEPMSLQQCKHLIEALAKCQLPFVCAHGRPSIIPLIDMAQKPTNQTDVVNITEDTTRNRLEAYQRWGSRRVLRKRC